jgi:opacity protein-like surface antigen
MAFDFSTQASTNSVLPGSVLTGVPQPSLPVFVGHGGVKDIWDVVGRFGVVLNGSALLYARGGYASSRQDFSTSLLAPDGSLAATSTGTVNKSGWVIGSGVQVTPDLQWTSLATTVFGVQYDYYRFDHSDCASGTLCGPFSTNVHTMRFRVDLLFNNHHPTCVTEKPAASWIRC